VAARRETVAADAPRGHVCAAALTPSGNFLATADGDGEVSFWNARTGNEIRQWLGDRPGEVLLARAPDGETLAVASGKDGVRLLNLAGDKQKERKVSGTAGEPIASLALGADHLLAAAYQGGGLRVWDLAADKVTCELKCPGGAAALAFAPAAKLLAAAASQRIHLWDPASGRELRSLEVPAQVACLAFAPVGKLLAAGMFDGSVRLWDLTEQKEPRVLDGHASAILAVAFSGDGRSLATASFDRSVRLWETASGRTIQVWNGHRGPVTAVAVAGDGRTVASGSADTSLLLWDVTGGQKDGRLVAAHLTAAEVEELWKTLADEDPQKAHRALWKMVAGAKDSVPRLKGRVFLTDPERVRRLIAELDDEDFGVRESATKELKQYGRWIEGALDKALQRPTSTEARGRLHALLDGMKGASTLTLEQERLRARRMMQILEQSGLPQAQEILQALARGATEADIRDEARASLGRMKKGDHDGGAGAQ
jgi:hypothetical protein